jgi:hypothetical protein
MIRSAYGSGFCGALVLWFYLGMRACTTEDIGSTSFDSLVDGAGRNCFDAGMPSVLTPVAVGNPAH